MKLFYQAVEIAMDANPHAGLTRDFVGESEVTMEQLVRPMNDGDLIKQ